MHSLIVLLYNLFRRINMFKIFLENSRFTANLAALCRISVAKLPFAKMPKDYTYIYYGYVCIGTRTTSLRAALRRTYHRVTLICQATLTRCTSTLFRVCDYVISRLHPLLSGSFEFFSLYFFSANYSSILQFLSYTKISYFDCY